MNKNRFYEKHYGKAGKQPVFVYRKKALKIFAGVSPCKLLDVGCDEGKFGEQLKGLGFNVYGVDIRREAVKKASQRINAVLADAEEGLPFGDNSFGAAYVGDVIEHVYDTDALLLEVRRVLQPGGLVVVTTPNIASITNRFRLFFGKLPVGNEVRVGNGFAGHIRNYSSVALKEQLESLKFRVIRRVSSNIPFPVTSGLFGQGAAEFFGDFCPNWGSHVIIAARKEEFFGGEREW